MSLKNEAQVTAAPSDSRAQAFQGCSALVPQGLSTEPESPGLTAGLPHRNT